MRNLYITGLITIVATASFLLYIKMIKPHVDNKTIPSVSQVSIYDEIGEFYFTYPYGENAYTLIEPPVPTTTSTGLQKVYIVMNTQEYIAFENNDLETPPTVSVFVLEKADSGKEGSRIEKMFSWAERFPQFSSYPLRIEEPEIIDVEGVPALHYYTEGNYKQEVYVASYKGIMYVFTGQYEYESDEIYVMFKELIDSVVFD